MKRFVLVILVSLFFISGVKAQFVHWTFEGVTLSGTAATTPSVTAGSAQADAGTLTAGSAFTGLHASASTVWSTPAGNGSLKSLSSNNWGVGDYYQFQFATTGFQDIVITWDATGSNTGPRDFKVQYSTDGTIFSDATGTNSIYSLTNDAWSNSSYNPLSTRTLDLSSVTALNNAPNVYIRLVNTSAIAVTGGAVATTGTSRVDDFKVDGNVYTTNTIAITTITPLTFNLADCFATAAGTVDFTSVGTFTAGNIYTAQLSDAAGAFGTPVNVGTLTSTANSGTINIMIPAGTASGTIYKIRIKSDNPNVTSSLSADITINQSGSCNSASTDFFRSKATGDWNVNLTWETSATGTAGTWIAATITPTSAANVIQIRNGDIVSITSTENVDQIVIENGGTLNHVSGIFTINDGALDDVDIQNGGVFHLSSSGNPPQFGAGTPVVNIATGAILRVSASGHTAAAPANGVNAANYVYQHLSVLEWTLGAGFSFSSSGVTYFPNVNATTIPIFRTTNSTAFAPGANSITVFNGIFEANGTAAINWTGTATKTFRNGIRGTGSMNGAGTGMFIIDGITAELGGTGSLITPIAGLQIGSASNNTTVTVTSNKTVTGDISLVSTNTTYVDLGTNNLTVTGNVTNGTATSYIRTATTGALILNSVGIAGKNFPVGDSKYNPILIENGSNHSWTVNVNDGVMADPPKGSTGAVLLTWNITPSTNPPSGPADITFQFDRTSQVGIDFDNPAYNSPDNLQPWHRKLGYWLASGTNRPVINVSPTVSTVKAPGLVDFSPYALARILLPLPIKLVNFSAIKISSGLAIINWELAACCSKDALFELEKSIDSRNFTLATSINGSETNKFYFYNDSRLGKGISYYRLKMTDADGSVKYSQVIAIVNDEKGFVITSIAPNPVQHTASLTISAAKQSSVDFKVYDMTGNLVKQWESTVASGINVINMEVGALANGTYHVLASLAGDKTVFRFIKQ